jgi:hypothetical protein
MGSDPDMHNAYDLAEEPAKPAPPRLPPREPPPTLGYRGPVRDEAHSASRDSGAVADQAVVNLHLPLWLLVGGIVVEVIALWWGWTTFRAAMTAVGLNLIVGTIFMLVGVLIAARIRQIRLGDFWTVVLKLAAISVATDATVTLMLPVISVLPLGGLIGLGILFVVYFVLLGSLFDLDQSDTWYFIMVLVLLWLILYFALGALEAALT